MDVGDTDLENAYLKATATGFLYRKSNRSLFVHSIRGGLNISWTNISSMIKLLSPVARSIHLCNRKYTPPADRVRTEINPMMDDV